MIPLIDLKKQYRSLKSEFDAAIERVLDNSQFILGPEVAAFEEEFSAYSGVNYGIGVNSGTSALHLALLAAGIGPGDEVITAPFTFVATVGAIRYTGARPVFVDIDPETFTMDPDLLEIAITERTKAIIPVHLYGQCADMDPICGIARRRGLVVIEDAAQAHRAEYKGRRAGSIGDMACFSFYPGKNLGAFGEGGMVVTNNRDYADKIRMMRDWGQSKRYYHDVIGFNYRLEGIQGAILRVKLRHLDRWTEVRRASAALYSELLSDSGVVTPKEASYAYHVYHCYVIRTEDRQQLVDALKADGIQTGIHYPIPVHLQQAHRDLEYGAGDFPHSENAAREVLSLPMHGDLTTDDVHVVSASIRNLRSPLRLPAVRV
jgi:dTDP-4-amino-4,6-dideoxygalactose transaminase